MKFKTAVGKAVVWIIRPLGLALGLVPGFPLPPGLGVPPPGKGVGLVMIEEGAGVGTIAVGAVVGMGLIVGELGLPGVVGELVLGQPVKRVVAKNARGP